MAEVRVPALGESVTEGQIARWMKKEGDWVDTDEPLLELETDKAAMEIPAPEAGVLHILKDEGDTVQVGEAVARLEPGEGRPAEKKKEEASAPSEPAAEEKREEKPARKESESAPEETRAEPEAERRPPALSPAVRRLVEEHDLDPSRIEGSGRRGRVTKADVLAHLEGREDGEGAAEPEEAPAPRPEPEPEAPRRPPAPAPREEPGEGIERVPMSRMRQRIAERLVQAQQTAAILTTFNEVDMSGVMALRKRYKESFSERHGVGLGFMSFFARACAAAMRDVPRVNAQIDDAHIVYFQHMHLGVAVGTDRGLVVPVLRHVDRLSFAEIEAEIGRLAELARKGKLSIDDLSGGTFTISNGGVYGSLLSTPILNPPQTAILGMHKIEKRPVVVNDEIVIRPMMYLALSYDHRLIDGAEAVTFLVRVKERLEDPARLLLDV